MKLNLFLKRAGIFLSLLTISYMGLFISCTNSDNVTLRRFPYPYRAALAICSDIDETSNIEELLGIQSYLDGNDSSALGHELNLEVGNSFWFFNSYLGFCNDRKTRGEYVGPIDGGLSIYKGVSDTLDDHADILLNMVRYGYLDCLHSYGHFGDGTFNRRLALRAAELFKQESLSVDVYINHGTTGDLQNIGPAHNQLGDNRESPYYNMDITRSLGIKFLWRGQVTHCIGQSGNFSIINWLKNIYESIQDWRYSDQDYVNDNELVHEFTLDDSTVIFDFVRYINEWGKYSETTERYFINQLGPGQIDELIGNEGYLVFYTHLGKNDGPPYLSNKTCRALKYVKKMNESKQLLVTTTSKLLNYYIHQKYLYWHSYSRNDSLIISIDSIANKVEGCYVPDENDLSGITFKIESADPVNVEINGIATDFVIFNGEATGERLVSIPWVSLPKPFENLIKR